MSSSLAEWMGGATHTALTANVTLSQSATRCQTFYNIAASKTVTLPDARTVLTGGPHYYFVSLGPETFTVKNADGVTVGTVAADEMATVVLSDNSDTAGDWHVMVKSTPGKSWFMSASRASICVPSEETGGWPVDDEPIDDEHNPDPAPINTCDVDGPPDVDTASFSLSDASIEAWPTALASYGTNSCGSYTAPGTLTNWNCAFYGTGLIKGSGDQAGSNFLNFKNWKLSYYTDGVFSPSAITPHGADLRGAAGGGLCWIQVTISIIGVIPPPSLTYSQVQYRKYMGESIEGVYTLYSVSSCFLDSLGVTFPSHLYIVPTP